MRLPSTPHAARAVVSTCPAVRPQWHCLYPSSIPDPCARSPGPPKPPPPPPPLPTFAPLQDLSLFLLNLIHSHEQVRGLTLYRTCGPRVLPTMHASGDHGRGRTSMQYETRGRVRPIPCFYHLLFVIGCSTRDSDTHWPWIRASHENCAACSESSGGN